MADAAFSRSAIASARAAGARDAGADERRQPASVQQAVA